MPISQELTEKQGRCHSSIWYLQSSFAESSKGKLSLGTFFTSTGVFCLVIQSSKKLGKGTAPLFLWGIWDGARVLSAPQVFHNPAQQIQKLPSKLKL